MLSWLAPLLVFGLVILVHEAGHFLAAKLTGVYAPRFSIGFGPALWRRRWGETEYLIRALPFGGYVRMASREDETMAFLEGGSEVAAAADAANQASQGGRAGGASRPGWDPEATVPFGPKPVPEHRWFESKPLWARLVIMFAGVTMNVVLTFVVSTGLYAGYGRVYYPPVVDSVVAGGPAARAGLQVGDSIVSVDGEAVRHWTDMRQKIVTSAGQPLQIGIVRDGQSITLNVTPALATDTNLVTGEEEQVGQIGAASRAVTERERLSLVESVQSGWSATWIMGTSVLDVVKGLVTGAVSVSQLGGPIEIARTSVVAARSGLETLFSLIAFLSINVAILNLLPIPILDGGQILLHVAEAIKGSAFSARTREYILRAGLVAIALLFVLVMFNDIKGLLSNVFQ